MKGGYARRCGWLRLTALATACACAFAVACGGGDSNVPSGWTGYAGDGYRAATAPGWELLRLGGLGGGEVRQLPQLDAQLSGLRAALVEALLAWESSTGAGNASPQAGQPTGAVTMLRMTDVDVIAFGDRGSGPPFALMVRPCAPRAEGGEAGTVDVPAALAARGWGGERTMTVDGVEVLLLSRQAQTVTEFMVQRAAGECVDTLMFVAAQRERVTEFVRFLGTLRFEQR